MKATTLLERQHRHVETIFEKLDAAANHKNRKALVEALANELAAHMAIEQDLFYPRVRVVSDELVGESFEAHAIAEFALKRLLATEPDDPAFLARVATLEDLVDHHVDEEEGELFPAVEKKFDEEELEEMGRQMKAMFDAAVQSGYEALLPKSLAKT
jgi:hemerythrin superfamily protein